MTLRKLLLVFSLFLLLCPSRSLKAQDNCIAIAINEYCTSNIPGTGGLPDGFGEFSDWVELKCNFTSSVSLAGYYLSNDRNNLQKWPFPSSFTMGSGSYRVIRLSGRNLIKNDTEYHTNFTIDQCKNQWIILSTSAGVIRDSVFVRPAKANHSWGRIDCSLTGQKAFRLFQDNFRSPGFANGGTYANFYAPTPKLFMSTPTTTVDFNESPNKGGFYAEPVQLGYFKLNGKTYDTASFCYDIFYTLDGSVPIPGYPPVTPTVRYIDSLVPVTIPKTSVVRFISVPKVSSFACPAAGILPSFIETNTYFTDPTHQTFSPEFGVISISLDDKNWFISGGTTSPTIHVEYYDQMKQVSEGYAIINKPVQESWLTEQKGFYISIDDRFGSGCNFEGPIFNVEGLGTSTRTLFPTLHLKGGDLESFSESFAVPNQETYGTAIRDVFIQSLAAKNKLHVNPLHIKPVITFINGEYSGVFDLREVFDKYYENYYNGQSMDSLDLNFLHINEGNINYWDNAQGSTTIYNDWRTGVYDLIMNNPMNGKNNLKYKLAMERLDKASFIDYMILQSFTQNQDNWKYNVGFGRGHDKTKPGYKWHYYLWNMPSTFNFTTITNAGVIKHPNPADPSCYIHQAGMLVDPGNSAAYNGHSNMLAQLMGTFPGRPTYGNDDFKLEYKNRYQDLLNGPLKCDNLIRHYDYVVQLFRKEMICHADAGCEPFGDFHTTKEPWDTNTAVLRRGLQARCYSVNSFTANGCYNLQGPFDLSVDVRPAGAGKVKVNTMLLDSFVWYGKYYQTTMSFKAIATNTTYAFHHWEFNGPIPKDPLSMDSIGVNFNTSGQVVAVFTDKSAEIIPEGANANVPTGFTPNGDGHNEIFRPLGTAEYVSDYQMTIWNRWGQEVFRSLDPFTGWDGNYKGAQALTGVYAYVITYKNLYNESKLVKGNVTLTR